MTPQDPARDLGRPVEGVAWMLASGLAFVGVNAIVRALGTELPAAQSAFIRFAFGILFFAPVLPRMLRQTYSPHVWRLFVGRGLAHTVAVLFWFYAMARLPLAHITAIGYLSPVIVLFGGAVLMGERLTKARIAAVGLAILGALIVLRPGVQPVGAGHLAQIAAAIAFATSFLFAKSLSSLVPASVVVAIMSVTVTLGLAPLAYWQWVPVPPLHLLGLAVVAVLATLGHYLMTRAFRAAPLAVTQPVIFLQLVWASLVGTLVFHEPVDIWVLFGGGVIIGAISWVTWRESVAKIIEPMA